MEDSFDDRVAGCDSGSLLMANTSSLIDLAELSEVDVDGAGGSQNSVTME